MERLRKLGRRSFLRQVAGGGALGAMALVSGGAGAQPARPSGLTDRDRGAIADPAGGGRGPPPTANGKVRSGVTDGDPRDPVGNGRNHLRRHSACMDGDPHDPGQSGMRICRSAPKPARGSGFTDGDPNDPALNGIGPRSRRTGLTDRDPTDRPGHGRGRR